MAAIYRTWNHVTQVRSFLFFLMQRLGIQRIISLRCCSSSPSSSASLVASLRKKTGYPIGKCKEALTRHGNDHSAAEMWLLEQAKKEGWAKAEKLMGRRAQQGLIGLHVKDGQAVMVVVSVTGLA